MVRCLTSSYSRYTNLLTEAISHLAALNCCLFTLCLNFLLTRSDEEMTVYSSYIWHHLWLQECHLDLNSLGAKYSFLLCSQC